MHELSTRPAKRLFYLDVARIAAILGVVAIHNWSLLGALEVGTNRWWMVDVLFTGSRWAVPLFVMISGGLLLSSRAAESPSKFYRRRLARVGVPTLFWIAAYFVFRATFLGQELTPHSIAVDLVMATPFVHLYFMYVIVGLYLVTPLLASFASRATRGTLVVAAAGLMSIPVLESLARVLLGTTGGGVTGLSYWIPFLGYFLAGRAFGGLTLTRLSMLAIGAAVVAVIGAQILAVYLVVRQGGSFNYPTGYFSIFTAVATVLLYVLVAHDGQGQNRGGLLGRSAGAAAGATFGVFLIHEMLLHWYAQTFLHGDAVYLVTARIPTYVVGVVGSFAIVLVARRIPILRSVF